MRDLLLENGLQPPSFSYDNGYFIVTLSTRENVREVAKVSPSVFATLNKRQADIVRLIQNREKVTSTDCANHFGVTKQAIIKDLGELVENGIIERTGRGRNTRYVLYGTSDS